MDKILKQVKAVRINQNKLWDDPLYIHSLETGEWYRLRKGCEERVFALLDSQFESVYEPADARSHLMRIAALAIAQIEALDRKHPGLSLPPERDKSNG